MGNIIAIAANSTPPTPLMTSGIAICKDSTVSGPFRTADLASDSNTNATEAAVVSRSPVADSMAMVSSRRSCSEIHWRRPRTAEAAGRVERLDSLHLVSMARAFVVLPTLALSSAGPHHLTFNPFVLTGLADAFSA